ncbi:DUF1315 family protein [Aliiglaciecola sp. CAU 1673]|uniref:YeaC family protein n=1 Tax=Aliiglaciecola sp. CAU 1673 TaxID=3032595 RepID=UPI0023DCC4AC|nr:DUF1315 family protein [Aliiglaciecola sp. CAU 1673]MDF2178752.1 DUF1315 family protein [Aliiglaciecola sp. CAU 1673]
MDIQSLLNAMTPQLYERLVQAVETGKWPDGNALTVEQKENCLQAVMLYQARVLQSEEHMTIGANGDIVHKSKQQLKQDFQPSIARFSSDDF